MIALLQQAIEHGVTFFDTAETCGPHRNETLGVVRVARVFRRVCG